jgi:hypothetical protein
MRNRKFSFTFNLSSASLHYFYLSRQLHRCNFFQYFAANVADPVHSLCRHETFLPAPAETEKAANEKAKKDGEKPKDKVRTAKKIQKDMEKWAKMLNQKKESQKVAVAPPAVLPAPAAPHTQKGGHRIQYYWDTCRLSPMICRYIDEGVVESGMGLFLIEGHLPKILPQHSKGASKKCVYYVWCTLFPPVAEICARLAGNFCE